MRRLSLLSLLGFSFTALLSAQTGQANGGIRGVLTDSGGGAVPNAKVAAKNIRTGFEREALTSERGEYELPLLPLGPYKVSIEAAGFAPFEQSGVTVELAKASQLDVVLQVGTAQQTITVTGDTTMLNTQTYEISGGMNQRSMENMPITSRNTFNLALFAPGFNGSRDDEFGNPTFAFGGMQRRAFLVDGIDNTQRGGPGRLGIFSPESIQEVKVIANAMSAEYGRTVGGMISMVTRGGSNDTHGGLLVLQRRPGLIARGSLQGPPKPFQQWASYNFNIGGKVIRDRLFYFVSAEYQPLDGPRAITITPANAALLNIPASDLGSAPFKQRFQTYLGRLDYQLNSKNNFYVRYSNFNTPSQFNTSGGTTVKSASNNFDDRNDTVGSQFTSIISPKITNEARFGFLRREFRRPPVSGVVGPIITITGAATLGSNTSANQGYEERQYNFIDQLSWRTGRQQIKTGVDIDTIRVTSSDRLLLQYTFASVNLYLNTLRGAIDPATGRRFNYTQLTQDFGDNTARHRTTPINLFLQDDVRISEKLTVNLGVRWEYRIFPELPATAPLAISRNIPDDKKNFAPRVGFAWQTDSKTVVRGGYGLFYDTLNLRLISQVYRNNAQRVLRYTINGNDPNAPAYPAAFTAANANFLSRPSAYGFSPDFSTQYAHQANLQVERQVLRDLSVTAGVQWYGGHAQPIAVDANLGPATGTLADGRARFTGSPRPNPAYNQILELRSVGNSVYYGGFLSVNKRFAGGFQLAASYTLGYAFNTSDSTGDAGASAINPTNLRRDWGWSSSDQRHRFVAQGVWMPTVRAGKALNLVLNGWLIAPNLTYTSAFPISAVAGTDLNGDLVNNDYPVGQTRNVFRGYGFQEVNMRVSRTFTLRPERVRLELIGEAENLMNSTNPSCTAGGCGGVTNFSAANFRQPTSAFNSRQIQIGGRLRF